MKTLTVLEQQELTEALTKLKVILKDFPGVVNVGIGLAMMRNVLTDEPAIIVSVRRKRSLNELRDYEKIPKSVDNIRIDIIEANPVEDVDPYSKIDKLIGGINISNTRLRGLGTLGGIFYDQTTNKPVGITNWHVAKNLRGRNGDKIVQPGGTNPSQNSIGTLTSWNRNLDCARIDLTDRAIEAYSKQNHITSDLKGLISPLVGMSVQKSGARTGLTFGVIQAIFDDDIHIVPNPEKTPENTEISMSGDSGSLWISDDGDFKAIALHWGGDVSAYRAYAKNIVKVASLLNLKL